VLSTHTKGPFSPDWCYQPGLKALRWISSKGKHPIQSHMCCVGGLERYT